MSGISEDLVGDGRLISSRFSEVLNAAIDAVVDVLSTQKDWGPSKLKHGQYAFDLSANEAALPILREGGLRVLSEESGLDSGSAEPGSAPVAVIDPVDGSSNASRGMRFFATSICVVDGEGPLVSVVYNHGSGERYEAVRGGGAFCNGTRLTHRSSPNLGDAMIAVNGLPPVYGGWAQFRALGAAALEICAVADGRLDGYIDFSDDGLGPWDYLGALLVCTESGIHAQDAHQRDLITLNSESRRALVAAPIPLADDLLKIRAKTAIPSSQ